MIGDTGESQAKLLWMKDLLAARQQKDWARLRIFLRKQINPSNTFACNPYNNIGLTFDT